MRSLTSAIFTLRSTMSLTWPSPAFHTRGTDRSCTCRWSVQTRHGTLHAATVCCNLSSGQHIHNAIIVQPCPPAAEKRPGQGVHPKNWAPGNSQAADHHLPVHAPAAAKSLRLRCMQHTQMRPPPQAEHRRPVETQETASADWWLPVLSERVSAPRAGRVLQHKYQHWQVNWSTRSRAHAQAHACLS